MIPTSVVIQLSVFAFTVVSETEKQTQWSQQGITFFFFYRIVATTVSNFDSLPDTKGLSGLYLSQPTPLELHTRPNALFILSHLQQQVAGSPNG